MIAALLLALLITTASAQGVEVPLVFVLEGDLYRWYEGDTTFYQLSNWRFNDEASVSPDGSKVAYHSYARVTVEAINRTGGFGGGKGPGNIWVIDTATGDGTRLIDQPADAAFLTDNGQDNAIVRSRPFWSPDGTKVGWTELKYPSGDAFPSLWVYDFTTSTAQKLTDLPIHVSVNGLYDGFWTKSGIVLDAVMWNVETGEMDYLYLVYSETGELLNEITLENTDQRRPASITMDSYTTVLPVEVEGRDYLLTHYQYPAGHERDWVIYSVLPGDTQLLPGISVLRGYSALDPDDSVSIAVDGAGGYHLFDKHGQQLVTPALEGDVTILKAAISADGEAVAYYTSDNNQTATKTLEVWRDGELTRLPPIETGVYLEEMLWSPIVWRVE